MVAMKRRNKAVNFGATDGEGGVNSCFFSRSRVHGEEEEDGGGDRRKT